MDRAEVAKAYGRLMMRTRREGRVLNGKRCLVFTGAKDRYGYGTVRVGTGVAGAHRLAFIARHGPPPPGIEVMHRCDNPPCVEDAHLQLGTHGDNLRDCIAKGRHNKPRGRAAAHHIKLTDAQVAEIRGLRGQVSQRELGRRYGVAQTHISRIQRNVHWSEEKGTACPS